MAAVEPALAQPPKPLLVRPLFAVKPVWLPGQAAVAGATVTITLAGVWSVSDAGSAVMSLAGAMTVLFARGEPYVHRARTVTGFALLVMAMSAGALWLADSRWTLLALLTVMAGLAAAATEIMRTPVPGPALLLVPTTIVVGVPLTHTSELWHRVAMMAIGAAVALVVTLAPWLLSRQGPEHRAVLAAYRAIADAARSTATARFAVDRSAAWTAVARAQRALALARGVPGRNTENVGRLCALGDHAPRVLHTLELVALQEGAELPARVLERTRALPAVVARLAAGQAVAVHPVEHPASAGPVVRALEHELADVPRVAERTDVRQAGQADPGRVGSPRLLRPLCRREWALVVRVTVLTLVTGAVTILIGLDRWYWAPVCAVATLSGSHTWMTWYRAAQRGLATVVGGVVGVVLLQPRLPFPAVIVIVGALFFLAELSFPRNYGLAMIFVTPMVLLTIHSAGPVPLNAAALSWDRIATTLVGCVCGVLGVLLLLSSPSTRLLAERIGRSLELQRALVADAPAHSAARHDTQLCALIRTDLAELHLLATDALGEARGNRRARALWPVALSVSRTGYVLLALSALAPESWARSGRDGRRHDVGETADAIARELASPRPQFPAILDRELRLLRSVALADGPGNGSCRYEVC
ncbi:FUSC family protein [Streptomyces sp. NPDC102274]|uniref:FUSC family protein n=1 Tax=Streptomyces sp. NPDC102274 TaxID=3366151 RepID=UPI003814E763